MRQIYLGCGVLAVIALSALGAFSLWSRKPAEAIVKRALGDAEQRIGRQITVGKFGGNPFRGFRIYDIALKSKVEGQPDALQIDSLKLKVSLPMLLRRKVVFKELQLLKPAIYLELFVDGGNSIQDILETMVEEDGIEKKPSSVFFQRIVIRGISLKMNLLRENPIEIVFGPINLTMNPVEKDSYGSFSLRLDGKMEDLELSGDGSLQMAPEFDLAFDWKTNRSQIDSLPDFLSAYFEKMEVIDLKAAVEASGNVRAGKETLTSESHIALKDAEALFQKFGDGFLNVKYGEAGLRYDGELGKGAPEVKLVGVLQFGEEPLFSSLLELGGIDVTPAVRVLLRGTAPDIISGTLSGDIHSDGTGLDMKTLNTDAILAVKNGVLNYPTPALKGEGSGRAPLNFERIDISLNHKQPKITVRQARIVAQGISATASGFVTYLLDGKTGAPSGPASFDINFNTESKNIEEFLKLNKYTGPAISGSHSTSGNLKGNSSDVNSLTGTANFALLDGIIVNPYMDGASKLPINDSLSHFAFDSIKGRIDISDGVATSQSIKLLSSLIKADAQGSINFDGAMKAHVDASLDPSTLTNIADFQSVLPKINDALRNLDRVDASFELSGSVQQPLIHWNADEFANNMGKQMLENKADDFLGKLDTNMDGNISDGNTNSLKEKIKDKLKGFFH